ncbi:hypothetical protein QMO56_23850 [Roseomonas sp. E05]|uniref:hypothetical protein n=1 Tax=Roseomonas sp. E05 TaxID=3046310 RepID=UPI0024B9DA69|nr:hypothetical protein [Roseomonas sp. E05]MDJ0391150.1 hypothetical protein [Roseomonas sp. E05]
MAYFLVADLTTLWGWGRTLQAAEALAWWNAEAMDMLHEGPRLSLSDHRVPRSVWADQVDLYEGTEALYRLALAQGHAAPFRLLTNGRLGEVAAPQEGRSSERHGRRVDELDEIAAAGEIGGMPPAARSSTPRKPTGTGASRPRAARPAQVKVPPGLSAEEARRALAAVAQGAAAVQRTHRGVTLGLEPTSGRSASRFRIVRLPQRAPVAPPDSAEAAELPPEAARAALQRAYARGAEAAAGLLAGPDMLSSDALAARLHLSREAVHQKRRRGELLGLEGAKRGVRFPAWQLDADGRPLAALPALHAVLGEPWAVFRFLRQRHPELGLRTGLEAASDPRQAAAAVALARRVGGAFSPAGA